MSIVQRLVLAFVSRERAATIEAESRAWMLRCSQCEYEVSVWDRGGIRAGASGNPSYFQRCAGCGERTNHALRKAGGE